MSRRLLSEGSSSSLFSLFSVAQLFSRCIWLKCYEITLFMRSKILALALLASLAVFFE